MDNNVKLIYQGKEAAFPVIEGTLGDAGIDIETLRNATNLITLDIGYKNTGSTVSKITYLDGEKGELLYRGYPIQQLAEKSNFTEVMYLLLHGELPDSLQYTSFSNDMKDYNFVNEDMLKILTAFPSYAHPMGVLSSLTGALTAFNPTAVNANSPQDLYRACISLLGQFPILAAWTYRKMMGYPVNYGDDSLNWVQNFYQMLFKVPYKKFVMNDVAVDALDKLLILHADHEQNCSTSTVRMVGSSHAGLFTSISAGISALWGPRHGGANQEVMEMLQMIKSDGSNVQKWVDKAKDKTSNFRLMGFGHRVYKNFDPRARIIKKATDDLLNKLGVQDPILDIALKLEEVALKDPYFIERKLYPNVDFYSGIIYKALGIPTEMYTVMFAVGRLPGWISQWKEMREGNQPIDRPRQVYQGYTERNYVSITDRK